MTRGRKNFLSLSFLFLLLLLLPRPSEGWVLMGTREILRMSLSRSRQSPAIRPPCSQLFLSALPEGYQEFGEHVIRKTARSCGILNDEDLSIEWKADRLVVTVQGKVYVSADEDNEDFQSDNDPELRLEQEFVEGEDVVIVLDGETNPVKLAVSADGGVDVTLLARAINAALDDDDIGLKIAEAHEIEVTTPGASDKLQGQLMFDAYRGFDVICQQQDLEKNNVKQVEGRLVERNEEFTIINVKGRVKKMKNETVMSVCLPKAKKEKGGGGKKT